MNYQRGKTESRRGEMLVFYLLIFFCSRSEAESKEREKGSTLRNLFGRNRERENTTPTPMSSAGSSHTSSHVGSHVRYPFPLSTPLLLYPPLHTPPNLKFILANCGLGRFHGRTYGHPYQDGNSQV